MLSWLSALICPDPAMVQPLVQRSSKWPAVRAKHLEANPECAACGEKDKRKLDVHHIRPVHLQITPALELDPRNLISLCGHDGCNAHFLFGHGRDWRAFNPFVRTDVLTLRAIIKGRCYK